MKNINLSKEQVAESLAKDLDHFEWFYDVRCEKNDTITVYCSILNSEVFVRVPEIWYGYKINLAFAINLYSEPEKIEFFNYYNN